MGSSNPFAGKRQPWKADTQVREGSHRPLKSELYGSFVHDPFSPQRPCHLSKEESQDGPDAGTCLGGAHGGE